MKSKIFAVMTFLIYLSVFLIYLFSIIIYHFNTQTAFDVIIIRSIEIFFDNFFALFMATLVITILTYVLSAKLAKTIYHPINELSKEDNIEQDIYPHLRKVALDKREMSSTIAELETKIEQYDTISMSMKEGLLLLDSDGKIMLLNKSCKKIFLLDDNYLGKNIIELTRNREILSHTKKVLDGEQNEYICDINAKTYKIYLSPVPNGGAVMLFLDISQKLIAEKMRRDFSANVSHELKTPLTIISGYSEIMASGIAKSDDYIDFSAKIKNESNRLLTLIDNIIRLSQLDEITDEDIDQFAVNELIESIAERIKPVAEEKNVTVKLNLETVFIKANKQLIDEMIFNLVENSIKYNKEDGNVFVECFKKNDKVYIIVEDTGIGIDKALHDRVFERFYRVDASRSKKTGGTGLGLSIVKHIVEKYGGKIEIDSKLSVGTKITVKI